MPQTLIRGCDMSAGAATLGLAEVPIVNYGDVEDEMVAYRAAGTERAMQLGNRGPIRFTDDGNLHPEIAEAYSRCGFYVFTGVLGPDELADIEADVIDLLDRCPTAPDAATDRHGRPALGAGHQGRNVSFVRPLTDPYGGTDVAHGRHPFKMFEPSAPDEAPEWVVQVISGSLQFSEACLRLYGHPGLLGVAQALNGPDFTPFNEVVWIKQPGLGGSVAWHQDGWTHWDHPELDEGTHGFNFMAQLYGCDATNGLWVVPGSHRMGKVDIKAMCLAAGSDRLPDAVPVVCDPGDVAITSRQAIHGSFANTSERPRVTLNFGFHRRRSVFGVRSGGVHNPISLYDEAYIAERSRVIGWAIDARSKRFEAETPFVYQPNVGREHEFVWDDDAREAIADYNLKDIGI